MKQSKHISDEELSLVASEKATRTSQVIIETHISQCQHCQERLLKLAVDAKWREEIVANCSDLIQEMNFEESVSLSPNQSGWTSPAIPSGDEFDLQTVDRMLGEVLQSPTHPEMLGRLGRYDIEGVIGSGGMGVVLRGFDRELHRPVAIKMILPRLSKNGTAKQRFAREARAAATVLHPNVIGIHDIGETAGVPWLVMPLIAGPTLQELVQDHGALPERDIVRIGMQVASGLAAAHSQGLVHRDVKPENVLVDNQINRVVITDFGLARRDTDESMTQTGVLAGSVNYMSPEQSRGGDLDARSDLFSLGGLLFYLATGEPPFRSASAMSVIHSIGTHPHQKIQSLNNEVSRTLSDVVDRLLEKRPEHRFSSAVELESFLNDYLVHLHRPLHAEVPTLPRIKHPKPKSNSVAQRSTLSGHFSRLVRPIAWLLALGVLVASAFVAVQYLATPNPGDSLPESANRSVSEKPEPSLTAIPPLAESARQQWWNELKQRHGLDQPEEFNYELRALQNEFRQVEAHHIRSDIVDSQFENQLLKLQLEYENQRRAIGEFWSGHHPLPPPVPVDETTPDGP